MRSGRAKVLRKRSGLVTIGAYLLAFLTSQPTLEHGCSGFPFITRNPNFAKLFSVKTSISVVSFSSSSNATSTTKVEEPMATSSFSAVEQVPVWHPFPEECVREDYYNGVILDASILPDVYLEEHTGPERFREDLGIALKRWKKEGRRGVWLKFPTRRAGLVPPSAELGFEFRTADPGSGSESSEGGGVLIMTKWLPEDTTPSRLPHPPGRQVGIGALIVAPPTSSSCSKNHRLLVVREKTGPAAARGLWKMVTGLADPGEDLKDSVVREVREETGLIVKFERVLCFREAHGVGVYRWASDMFFVCLARIDWEHYGYGKDETDEVNVEAIPLVAQEAEIADVRWMDVDEFASQGLWTSSPLYNKLNKVVLGYVRSLPPVAISTKQEATGDKVRRKGLVAESMELGYRPGTNTLYIIDDVDSEDEYGNADNKDETSKL